MKRPTLYKGSFRGTDGNGNDHYGPSYYSINEVDTYIEKTEAALALAQKDIGFYRCCALSGEMPKEGSQPSAKVEKDNG